MSPQTQVALVGRNGIVREGLRRILNERGFAVTASAATAPALLSGLQNGAAKDLIIVIDTTSEDPVRMIQFLRAEVPAARLVVLADQFDFEMMMLSFQNGASGYIIKEISCEPLVASLNLVATGEKVLPSQLADRLPVELQTHMALDPGKAIEKAHLSHREIEILRCLISGCPNKVISRKLDISEATVKVHVKTILRKIRVNNRTQAAIWAINRGIEGDTALDSTSASVSAKTMAMPQQLMLPDSFDLVVPSAAH